MTRAAVVAIEIKDLAKQTIESLSRVFHLIASELIRFGEVAHCQNIPAKGDRRFTYLVP